MKNLMTAMLLTVLPCGAVVAQTDAASAPASGPASETELARTIAEGYGFAEWGEVESLAYTFNVKTPKRVRSRGRGRGTWRNTR